MAIFDPRAGALLGDFAMQVAAAAANTPRNARFWQMVNGPYAGPRIVAEGDSWFCYPSGLLLSAPDDLILQLGREFAVATEAVPGDLVAAMCDTLAAPGGLLVRLDQFRADILLLSGGGNDLLGKGQLERLLAPGPKPLDDYFKTEAFRETFWSVLDDLETILRAALDSDPDIKAVIHGYDYAMPAADPRKGPWLRAPMLQLGIPAHQQQAVVDRIVDWFNRAQIELARRLNAEYGGTPRVHHADLRNDALTAQWHDEIHPSTAGFATMARTIRRAILKAHPLVA